MVWSDVVGLGGSVGCHGELVCGEACTVSMLP